MAIDTTAASRFNSSVMTSEETPPNEAERRRRIYLEEEDVSVVVLGMSEGFYECVRVNSEWLERGFLEGDIILFAAGEPEDGDIVLIEEDGDTRLGVASAPGYLLTRQGMRPLDPRETIVSVGRGLVRRLQNSS